jgi:hypothetical protein
MSAELQRDLGRLEAEVAALKADVDEMRTDLKTILAALAQVKGGWRVLMAAGALGAALMAGLLKIVPFIPWGR